MTLPRAGDGLPARELPEWTREKLFYVERYLDIFCTGMRGKWSLVYADLLAGPGLCVDRATGEEAEGSPLLAVRRREFRRIFLNDAKTGITQALALRTSGQPAGRIIIATSDCNDVVDEVRATLFPPVLANSTLGLAVIDPTGFQMSYDAIGRLTDGLRLDLLIIFMSNFLRRFHSTPEFERTCDRFFGTAEWRDILKGECQTERITTRKLLDLYEGRLRELGYDYVDDDTRVVNSKRSTVYHMILASKRPRGAEFFSKISQTSYTGQRRFL